MFRLIILFLIVNILSFGKLEDELDLLNLKEKRNIEKIIEKIEKKKDIVVYVKTVNGEETILLENPQKTIMVIIQKLEDDKIASELKFTEDLRMEEKEHELNLILTENKEYMFNGEYEKYLEKVLIQIDEVVDLSDKIVKAETEEEKEEDKQEKV